jgi:hypothetical protein
LLVYLLVCMFACSCCIVIGAFMSSRGGQIYKSTPGGGARSQFRELSFPLRRIRVDRHLYRFVSFKKIWNHLMYKCVY